jgi:preprotein translocase subunit SecA
LESENSLDTILNIFRQGDDFLDLWYNEFTKDLFLPVLFKVAKTKKEWHKLAQFLLEENVHSEPKSIVTDVLKELILAEKMPREQGLSLFQSTIEYVFKNIGNDDFLDTMFISSMISDIVDARLVELLPLLKQLYDNNLVDKVWAGKYEFVEKEIEKEIQDYDVKVQPTTLEEFYQPPKQKSNPEFREIMERAMNDPMFDAINSIFSDKIFYEDEDEDEKPVRLASPRNETFIQNEKIGRNDVCPCGSGKKYKKCHGKN